MWDFFLGLSQWLDYPFLHLTVGNWIFMGLISGTAWRWWRKR